MNVSKFTHPLLLGTLSLVAVGCGTTQTFEAYSPEEYNLQSLDRITDNEENQYGHPTGGDQGRDLFFDVRNSNGNTNVYRMANPSAKAMSPKTNGGNVNLMPAYCAKTDKIVFAGRQGGAMVSDLFMMDASQGAAIRRLTNTPGEYEYFPSISVDGKTLVFERIHATGVLRDAYIWRQNLATEQETQLCHGRMPSLSHDGRLVVFIRYSADGNSSSLVVMDTDGTNQTEITDAKMGLVEYPCFSPDDSQIVFQCSKHDKPDYDLWVVNRDGTNLTQLTFNKSFDGEPYWARDGRDGYIYFTSDRGYRQANYQIWRFKYGTYGGRATVSNNTIRTGTPSNYDDDRNNYHTVKQGETISKIASQYGVTVKELVRWNNLSTMTLKPGTKLKVSKM